MDASDTAAFTPAVKAAAVSAFGLGPERRLLSDGSLILDPETESKRVKALAKLYGSCPDFPVIEALL